MDFDVNGSTFKKDVSSDGVAIYSNSYQAETLENDTFTNDSVSGDSNAGGAIFSFDTSLTIADSTITGDSSQQNGGAVYFEGAGDSPALTITGSTVNNDSSTSEDGGAIYTQLSVATTLSGDTFTNDTAPIGRGGALYSNATPGSTLTISADTFTKDVSLQGGGAINSEDTTLQISGSTFSKDQATGGNGGAIDSQNTTFSATNSTFSSDSTSNAGGAVFLDQIGASTPAQTASISATTFTADTAAGGNGGGIYSQCLTLNLTGDTFKNNASTSGSGGALYFSPTTVNIWQSTFTNNFAQLGGGAIGDGADNGTPTLNLFDSTLNGNSTATSNGGSVSLQSGSAQIANDTFVQNTAVGGGGALYFAFCDVTIIDSTIHRNTSGVPSAEASTPTPRPPCFSTATLLPPTSTRQPARPICSDLSIQLLPIISSVMEPMSRVSSTVSTAIWWEPSPRKSNPCWPAWPTTAAQPKRRR